MQFTRVIIVAAIAVTGVQARHIRSSVLGHDLEEPDKSSLSLFTPTTKEIVTAERNVVAPVQDTADNIAKTKTYIMTLADDDDRTPAERCATLAKSNGGTLLRVYSHVFKGCSVSFPLLSQEGGVQTTQAEIVVLNNSPTVIGVKEDRKILLDPPIKKESGHNTPHMQALTTVTSWGLDRINQCALPLDGITTKQDATGVMVFIIDSGIFVDHDEFSNGSMDIDDDCHFSAIDNEPLEDELGHGTHVAATACGETYGVSSNCRLCSTKIIDAEGYTTWSATFAAFDHVLAKCKDPAALCVVNMSFGFPYDSPVNEAVANMVAEGIVVVAAAGNDGAPACAISPASEVAAITVGSTTDLDALSVFSNWGPCVDVFAPGSEITSAGTDSTTSSETLSGTSMAAPHVTGIAAAIRSAHKLWTPAEVSSAIFKSAVTLTSPAGFRLATVGDISCHTLCPSGEIPVEVRVFTGGTPEDTSWTLKRGRFIINSPDDYPYAFVWYSTALCLPSGGYVFSIMGSSSEGNAPYYQYGHGSYEILVRGNIVHSGVVHQSVKKFVNVKRE